mmetsp:Transcript_30506/g.73581  ORF Transcript_30506/g.73581 Transcript_30506/m.73581 type:complete len:618 (+) Transcript_30506:519-2372(+)
MNKRLGFLPPNGQSPASSGTAKTPAPFGAAKTLCAPGAAPAQAAGAPDATAARPALSPSEECGLTYASGSGGTLVKRCTNCTQPVSDCHHDASSCPHDFQWNNASQRSCIHAMALQGYTLVERDVKNHVIKFDRPCLFLPPSAPAALASCTSPSLPAVFDSGCGPVHCKQGPLTRPVVSFKLNGVAGSHPFTATPSSSAFLDTRTATGAPFRLLLPGTTYTSPAFPRTLISAGTLHRHGFSSHLRADGGTLVTPSGVHLPLSLHEGIYTFPSAAGDDRSSPCAFPAQVPTRTAPPSVVQRPPSPSGSTQRASSPLSPPPDDDVSPPPPPPTTTWSPAMLRQLDKVAVLHASNGHPGRSRLTRIVKAMAPDITRPSLQAVSLWYKHFPCEACIKAKARRPPSTLAHPPRAADPAGPGAKLSLDGAGHYKPTRRHNTDTIFATSVRSLLHAAYPTASTLADFAYESLLTWTPVTLADVPLVVRGDQQWPPPARSSTYAPTPSATDSSLGSKAPLKPTLPATSTLQLHFRCDSPVAFPSFLLGLPRAPSALPPAAPRRPAYERGGVSRTTQLASHASHPPRPHQWAPRPHHHAFPWDRVPSSHRVPGRSRVPSHGVHSVQ